jgi:class 3 adenylate cyclase
VSEAALTSSSLLLEHLNTPSAIDCINEYLEDQCGVAMDRGATIDKYIGDGAMLRFVPARSPEGDHVAQAVEAALEMQERFERLKESWINSRLPVREIYSRIGISCGTVHDAKLGHPQFQEITVIGEAVSPARSTSPTSVPTRSLRSVVKKELGLKHIMFASSHSYI